MYIFKTILSLTIMLFLTSCNKDYKTDTTPTEVYYKLTFNSHWTSGNFPTNYPSGNAHFSGLTGATHNSDTNIWKRGTMASPGIQTVAETGKKDDLIPELLAKQKNKKVDIIISENGIPKGGKSISFVFGANKSHSLVSIVSMIAPSPDWIIGISGVDLYDHASGKWKDSISINAKAYDAGTDDGLRFTSGDAPSNPHTVIKLLSDEAVDTDFKDGVHRDTNKYIGVFTLQKQ